MTTSLRNVAILLMLAGAMAPTTASAAAPAVRSYAPAHRTSGAATALVVPETLDAEATPEVAPFNMRDVGTADLATLLAGFTAMTSTPEGDVQMMPPSAELEALLREMLDR